MGHAVFREAVHARGFRRPPYRLPTLRDKIAGQASTKCVGAGPVVLAGKGSGGQRKGGNGGRGREWVDVRQAKGAEGWGEKESDRGKMRRASVDRQAGQASKSSVASEPQGVLPVGRRP